MSEPIVPFRETVIATPEMDMANEKIVEEDQLQIMRSKEKRSGFVQGEDTNFMFTVDDKCKVSFRIDPLEASIGDTLEPLERDLRGLASATSANKALLSKKCFNKISSAFERAGGEWATAMDRVICFGPRNTGPNVMMGATADDAARGWFRAHIAGAAAGASVGSDAANYNRQRSTVVSAVATGFQMATQSGPLCEEPMHGVAFTITDVDLSDDVDAASLQGSIISQACDSFRRAVLASHARLMTAMYRCDIQASAEVLGKVYGVLTRRRGRILSEDMQEGTTLFLIVAMLPAVESFGFAAEVREKTSGEASPQLVFDGWETLQDDPFWEPTTEEEVLHYGEKNSGTESLAKSYMDQVRTRKGLFVQKKIVEFAEKQRNLGKNK